MMPDPLIGQKIGDYELRQLIARSTWGVIYLGYDPHLSRYAALRISKGNATEARASRFMREAQSLARLFHPHIVPVLQFGKEDDLYYLAMRYIPNGLLLHEAHRKKKARNEWYSLPTVARMVEQLASAVDHAHGQDMVHRNLKPSNIILDSGDVPYITDFGYALVKEGRAFGTPKYLAPEQANDPTQALPASDQYALGVITYELLTQHLPFYGKTAQETMRFVLENPVPSPRQHIPTLPEAVDLVMTRVLAKNPEHRFESCTAFARALTQALLTVTPSASHAPLILFSAIGAPTKSL